MENKIGNKLQRETVKMVALLQQNVALNQIETFLLNLRGQRIVKLWENAFDSEWGSLHESTDPVQCGS